MRLTFRLSAERSLLTIAIALFPFYILPSGGLQPSHLIFLMLSLLVISRYSVPRRSWFLLIAILAAYALLVESIAGIVGGDFRHLVNPAFFLFNLLLMIGIHSMVLRNGASVLKPGLLVAVIFAVASVYLGGSDLRQMGEGGRTSGTFNNPNQLGFFSVCILSLSYLLYLEDEIGFSTLLGLIVASIFLSISSLSKAAMIANIAVLAFALRPAKGKFGIAVWIVLTLGLIMGFAPTFSK